MKRLYFDMDGVLVDFESGLAQQSEETLQAYAGKEDEIPGLFGSMQPISGAIEAVHELANLFLMSDSRLTVLTYCQYRKCVF